MHYQSEILGRKPWRKYLGRAYYGGPSALVDGNAGAGPSRQGRTGESIIAAAHQDLYEACSRGSLWSACDQGAGVAPGTALGTTACLVLYNPVGSGVRLSVVHVGVVYFSGTLGTGVLYHCIDNLATQAVPSSGTVLTGYNCAIGNTSTAKGVCRVGATVGEAPVAVRPLAYLPPMLATTVLGLQPPIEGFVRGCFDIEPGCSYQLQAVAAGGSTPKVSPSVSWEEVPLVMGV